MTRRLEPSPVELAERVLRQNWLRASATEPASPTRVRAPAATRGSGTGTPASRRSSGGASSRRGRGWSWRRCSPPSGGRLHRPHDLLGPAGLALAAPLLQRRLTPLVPDRDDPAAAAGLGLEDRRRRPGRGAADRRPYGLAGSQPRPRGRRPALDHPARRVGPRRLTQVRPGLGLAGQRADRLPAARPSQPADWASMPAASASAAARCSARRWSTRCGRSRCRRWGGPRRRRPWSSDSGTSAAASSSTRRSRAERGRRRSPGPRSRHSPCPTCRSRSAAAWSRSTCSNEARVPHPRSAALGRRPPSRATSRAAAAARSAATGAGRPGSTPPGWSGSACGGSATRRGRGAPRRRPYRRSRARRPARVLRPAHGHRPRRQGLRLVGPDRRAGRARSGGDAQPPLVGCNALWIK